MKSEWNGEELLELVVEGAELSLDALAREGMNRARPNVKVDTGMMRASGYSIGPKINTYQAAATAAESLNDSIRYKVEDAVTVAEMEAAFGFSVEYALAQEAQNPTLNPALESLAADVPRTFIANKQF